MIFEYEEYPGLPGLAWAAIVHAGSPVVRVLHGSRVETQSHFFVEGAWDGEFAEGRFDNCPTFTGTGARLTGDGVRFTSPNHNLERCYSIASDHRLLVSNSLVMLSILAGERLDPAYPYYYFDYIRAYRTGLRHGGDSLRMHSGTRVRFHDCRNLDVRDGRVVRRRFRDFGPASHSFDHYRKHLATTVDRVFRNARDPLREIRYRPLASISRGYDSPATAVLARECGCEDAVAFRMSKVMERNTYEDDNGKPIADRLGLNCVEIDRIDLRDAPTDLLKLHFQNPFGSIVSSMDQVSDRLDGAIFVTGRHGEHFWSTDPTRSLPRYQEPTARKTLVQNTLEFRLDRGYIDFHLPYTGGVFAPKLLRISRSPEMAPWRIGGDYDRPIPRRIVEEAGVERSLFGTRKMGGADPAPGREQFSEEARDDFLSFFHGYAPARIVQRLDGRKSGRFDFHEHGIAEGLERRLRCQYGLRSISEYVLGFNGHQRRRSPFLYTFHWGFEAVARRYRIALGTDSTPPVE